MPTEWSRITINVSPALAEEIRTAAKAERRSVASWVTLLIESKLARRALPLAAEAEQAPYESSPAADPIPKYGRELTTRLPHVVKTVVAKKKAV